MINETIPLILGTIALTLFLAIGVGAWILTMKNRRTIRHHLTKTKPDISKEKARH